MSCGEYIFLLLASGGFGLLRLNLVNTLPTEVALGGAIVAAVEENEAQEEEAARRIFNHQGNINNATTNFNDFTNDIFDLQHNPVVDIMDEARGKSHKHKKHKKQKYLYPLLIGIVLAKTILIPLILKMLTAISTSSFIMSKIALAATGLLALKYIFASSGKDRARFEIVHVPSKHFGFNDFSDSYWSDSTNIDVKTAPKQRLKYIPIKGSSSNINSDGFMDIYNKNKMLGTTNGYKYNFDSNLDGKPFL